MSKTPKLRPEHRIDVDIRAARTPRDDRAREIFMRTTSVAADPDGEHIWLLLKPKASRHD